MLWKYCIPLKTDIDICPFQSFKKKKKWNSWSGFIKSLAYTFQSTVFWNAQLSLIVIIWFHKSSCSLASHAMDWPSIQLVSLPTAQASQRSHLGQDGQFGELMEGFFFMPVNKWLRFLPISHHLINLVHRVKTMLFVASLWELLYRVDCSMLIHYTYNMWTLNHFHPCFFLAYLYTHCSLYFIYTRSLRFNIVNVITKMCCNTLNSFVTQDILLHRVGLMEI